MEPKLFEERLPPPPVATYELHGANAPNNAIPPPPMFSTQRTGSQTGKSVLPPSVARRIGSNHPVIKQQPLQTISTENIFVPTFDPMNYPVEAPTQPLESFNDIHSQSEFGAQMLVTEQPSSQHQDLQAANMPSIPPPAQFTQQPSPGSAILAPPTSVIAPPNKAPTRLPPQNLTSAPSNMMPTNIAAPLMFASTLPENAPKMFVPPTIPVEGKSNSGPGSSLPPSSNVFSPTSSVAQPTSLPEPIQPPVGSAPNIGPTSHFIPPPLANDAPSFYNPIVQEQPKLGQVSEPPPKPLIEPPKATGATNFRMNKKRPQYYSGPIEGIGPISNSIKPVIPAAESTTFQGAMFTPSQIGQNIQPSVPFDLNKPAETVPLIPQYNVANSAVSAQSSSEHDISQSASGYSHFDITHHVQNPEPQYGTAFDLSRHTTECYDQQEEQKESKGFGIIGSLKSKLSSIDINKIQHSVTNFFDPAYNDSTKEESAAHITQQNEPYSNAPYEAQPAQTNLEIYAPNAQHNTQQYNYDYQNQIYLNNEYYRYPNFQNQGQPLAGHCSNSHDYPSHSTHPKPFNSNMQHVYPEQNINTTMFQQPSGDISTHESNEKSTVFNAQEGPRTFKENEEYNAERKMDENVARAGPEVARLVQSTTMIEERFANFGDLYNVNAQKPIKVPTAEAAAAATQHGVAPIVTQDRTFISESFEQIQHETHKPTSQPIPMFDPNNVDLFAKMSINESNKEKLSVACTNKSLKETENISHGPQSADLFAKIQTNNEIMNDNQTKLFTNKPADKKENLNDEIKSHNLFSSPIIYEHKETPKDTLLNTLVKPDVPVLGVSSVPLFGLSTILAEKSKEYLPADLATSLSDKNSSMGFFDHTQKLENYGAKHADKISGHSSFSFFDNTPTHDENANNKNLRMLSGKSSTSCFENADASNGAIKDNIPDNQNNDDKNQRETENINTEAQDESDTELSICETCREINKEDDKNDKDDDQDLTSQLIENMTSQIQLSNPVEMTLTEPSEREPTNNEQVKYEAGQFDEISHITEETIETLQVQSAVELLEDVAEIKAMKYGWTESALKEDYNFNVDSNAIGFYGSNSLFFDKVPTSAEEVKQHEDVLARQMSMPSAPPAEEEEEDSKSDEAGKIDVNSIEQDASKDFPLFEEYVVEPSEMDDDEPKSEKDLDSFTNRVEKFKKKEPTDGIDHQSLFYDIAPQPISMVSYFDTGNYAVEAHYRNNNTKPTPSIPPGFEEEFKRRVALAKQREEKIRNEYKVPDTTTQTKTTSLATYCSSRIAPCYTKVQSIVPVGFNIEANITNLVDEQSEPLPDFPTPPILSKMFQKRIDNANDSQNIAKDTLVRPEEKKMKLPPIPNVFDPKPVQKDTKLPEFSLAPGFKADEETPLPELLTAFSSKADEKLEPILPPLAAYVASKADDNPGSIMPPFGAFTSLKSEENPSTMSSFSPFTSLKPCESSESTLPPFAAFKASKAEEQPEPMLPFGAFITSKPDEQPDSMLPQLTQYTSATPDGKSESMVPFSAFGTSKQDKTTLPPFSPFNTSTAQENPATILPPFGLFNTEKSDEVPELTTAKITASKHEENPANIMPPHVAFTTPKSEETTTEPKLPDPINFFADTATNNPPESFSRLASYFSSPPKTDHAKSFFELSQSQNHYRHASSEQKTKIIDLMNDLTSVNNITIPKDETIKHVNYFTVEYDTALPEFSKRDVELVDDLEPMDLDRLLTNCRHCAKIYEANFKVRKAVNENGEQGAMDPSRKDSHTESGRGTVTVNFDGMTIQEEPNESVAGLDEVCSFTS